MTICARKAKSTTYRLAYVAAVSMLLTACAKDPPPPEIVTVFKDAPKYQAPPECDPKADPKWVDPPDADVHLKESARIVRQNKQNSIDVGVKRTVCWDSYRAYSKSTSTEGKKNGKH